MNQSKENKAQGGVNLRVVFGIFGIALLPLVLLAEAPQWWTSRGVLNTNSANDYAAVNQGQVKNIAVKAVAELNANLPGGAGDALHSLSTQLSATTAQTNDYAAVNLGQLKAVAKLFYDRLIEVGYTSQYPWTSATNAANDYAMANIGQVKNLFSFDFTERNWTSNTLPDWWKQNEFGTTDVDPADDPDGDGLSNLEEYHQGINPNDFYNGAAPTLTIVSGGDQLGAPGTMLAVSLSVKVNQGTSNAPVTFSVTSGSALLTLTSDTTTTPAAASVTVRSTSIYTGTSGTPTTLAQAYIWLPAASGKCSTIQISATSGTKSVTLATTASAIDPVISAPSNVTATPTSPTTAEITWSPADENQNTTLQVSEDGGATWKTVAVVQAGIAAVTLTGLTPDKTIKLRALTGGNNPSAATSYDINNAIAGNSGGETSNSNGDADLTPLSKIIVTGRTAHVGGLMPGYPGFCDGRSRYLVSQVDWEYNYDCNYESFIPSWPLPGWPFPASGRHGEFNRETGEFDPLLCWSYGDGPIAGGYVVCNTIDNQTKIGDGACDYIGIEYKKYSEVMWNEYLIDDYVDDVEKWVGRIVFKGSFIDGVNYAGIARNLDDPEGEFYDQDGAYYSVTKLQYQFKVNKDLNGSVSYVKLFFEDSGAISASIGKIATNGETIVPSTALEIDPLNDELNPSKENGTWCILPIDITIWKKGDATPPTDGVIVKKGDTLTVCLTGTSQTNLLLPAGQPVWKYRQLKADGTYTDWQQFGTGIQFDYKTTVSGIFQVEAVFFGDDANAAKYARKKDEPNATDGAGDYSPSCKSGQPDYFGVCDTDIQIAVRKHAHDDLGDTKYAQNVSLVVRHDSVYGDIIIGSTPPRNNKCNAFVFHKASDAGATVPLTRGGIAGWRTSPPLAYDWYDPAYAIDGWTRLGDGTMPQPGFVISRPDARVLPGGSNAGQRWAHVGILDYDGCWIQAGSKTVNKFPHLTDKDYQPVGMRKYGN